MTMRQTAQCRARPARGALKGRLEPQNLLKGRMPSRPSSWLTRPCEKICKICQRLEEHGRTNEGIPRRERFQELKGRPRRREHALPWVHRRCGTEERQRDDQSW